MNSSEPTSQRLTGVQWLILILASIGFAFDIYEILMGQFIVRNGVPELTGAKPGTKDFVYWASMLMYLPAVSGGVFGLLGGYLSDILGRRRVLTWSILLYAISAFLAAYSTSIQMLIFFRCTTFIGVCVEFVAAVSWLAELFPDPHRRESVLGYTQAFSSFGGLMVAGIYKLAATHGDSLFAISVPEPLVSFWGSIMDQHTHEAWRYTLMSGLIPAFPLLVIRPFLPESPQWAAKRAAGTLKRASIAELFSPQLRRTTLITTLMFACSYGAAFGAIQQMPQIVPGLAEIKARGEGKKVPEQKAIEQAAAGSAAQTQELGGLLGRFALAILALKIASRRTLLRTFQIPGLILVPIVFAVCATTSYQARLIGIFFVGLFTVAQFSFWGNYLPRVYPLHLRGTGEGFAANIGGRLLGTLFYGVTQSLSTVMPGSGPPMKVAYAAAVVGTLVYLVGTIASFWLPEPMAEAQLAE